MVNSNSPDIYPLADWRVIVHAPLNGPMNMAIDEAIAEAVGAGREPSTLRFYSWQPGCLSLGYAQPADDVLDDQVRVHGWDVVRRLTGGRAILHIDELTYSVVTPLDDPRVEGGVVESYRRLSEGLMAGLGRIGAEVHAGKGDGSPHGFDGPVCFEVPSDYEITSGGKKLLGSAQTRRGGVVLQHGALPLFGDITRIYDALRFPTEDERAASKSRLAERAITLEDALGHRAGFGEVAGAIMEGMRNMLCLRLTPGELIPAEQARAETLRREKYASPEWTKRH
jgi:lipoate-protein ligase A